MTIRALVFDFDGLILETETSAYESWREIFADHGQELPLDLWRDTIGRRSSHFDALGHLQSLVAGALDPEAIRARRTRRRDELVLLETIRPGVRELHTAARAAGIKVAVATSSTPGHADLHLRRLNFDTWDTIVFGSDVERGKPDPDIYVEVARRLGVASHEVVALEDSPNGTIAAWAAGCYVVAVPNPLTEAGDFSRAHLRLGSLAEVSLADLIARGEAQRATPMLVSELEADRAP